MSRIFTEHFADPEDIKAWIYIPSMRYHGRPSEVAKERCRILARTVFNRLGVAYEQFRLATEIAIYCSPDKQSRKTAEIVAGEVCNSDMFRWRGFLKKKENESKNDPLLLDNQILDIGDSPVRYVFLVRPYDMGFTGRIRPKIFNELLVFGGEGNAVILHTKARDVEIIPWKNKI